MHLHRVHTHTSMHANTHTHTHTHTYTYTLSLSHTHTHTRTHTHSHSFSHTHTYTHTIDTHYTLHTVITSACLTTKTSQQPDFPTSVLQWDKASRAYKSTAGWYVLCDDDITAISESSKTSINEATQNSLYVYLHCQVFLSTVYSSRVQHILVASSWI